MRNCKWSKLKLAMGEGGEQSRDRKNSDSGVTRNMTKKRA